MGYTLRHAVTRGLRPYEGGRLRRAFTMFEVLLATVILAMISLSVSAALMAGRQQTANAQDALYGSFLAQALLEEIKRLPYAEPSGGGGLGPDAGETSRSTFDNQDDYHGYADGAGTANPIITDLAGNAYPGITYPNAPTEYQAFTRRVTITPTTYTISNWGAPLNGLLVTVTVWHNGKSCATLEQFITP